MGNGHRVPIRELPPYTAPDHHRSQLRDVPLTPLSPFSDMVHPSKSVMATSGVSTPQASSSSGGYQAPFASQHERLILELLPFKTGQEFRDWIQGPYVQGSWHEFCRDYLAGHPDAPDPDKELTAKAAKEAIEKRLPSFLMYHPAKQDWESEEHHVRFIVTVIADNRLKNMWSDSDWKRRPLEICKAVYEVLSYAKALRLGMEPMYPPSYQETGNLLR